jgi:aminobenzoyl-glutamate utilization protein B
MKTKDDVLAWIDENAPKFIEISDAIWDRPEAQHREFFASRIQADFLEKEGFKTTWEIGGLRTAFISEWGQGRPIIGFIGEYDALAGLSQKKQPTPEPVVPGEWGHGCGHNLLGTGGMASALAVKKWMEENGVPGTVRYYGCPAEENGSGKTFMARAGAFDDLDAAFNFHPHKLNFACMAKCVGVFDIRFRFHGRTAHAGGSPHLGRSALDAVELMNVGVNYLREHVGQYVRIHYAITHGGDLPNIVPAEAEVWYFVRALDPKEHMDVLNRVRKIAEGAAMMTETKVEEVFRSAASSVVSNQTLADLQYEAMEYIGPIDFTDEEKAYAQKINDQFPKETIESGWASSHLPREKWGQPLYGENFPSLDIGKVETGSTDMGDVGWITPVAMLNTACEASGAVGHSWAITATTGMSIGHKGMIHAVKIMALAAMDVISKPEILKKAQDEFKEVTGGTKYQCPIPDYVPAPRYDVPAEFAC